MRRVGDPITLAVEHRAAPSGGALAIALRQCGDALALEIVDRDTAAAAAASPRAAHARAPVDRIERALTEATEPLTVAALRAACHMRTATLCDILAALVGEGRVRHTAAGYILAVA